MPSASVPPATVQEATQLVPLRHLVPGGADLGPLGAHHCLADHSSRLKGGEGFFTIQSSWVERVTSESGLKLLWNARSTFRTDRSPQPQNVTLIQKYSGKEAIGSTCSLSLEG